ncbi:hypothetical protein GCM10027429_07060 [Marivirga atlantica]|jgi:glycosyltransferase involved in cell wall biosynthesis
MPTIFVFAYYSYKDPVFQSAVLPYLQLNYSEPIKFILLTWEQQAFKLNKAEQNKIRASLKEQNIEWYTTNWHSGRFKLVKKIYDFIAGLFMSLRLIRKHKCKKIYSEGFPGAIIGHYLSKLSRKPHAIHTFEPHADYMLESQVWEKSSWEYQFLKKMEVPIAKNTQHIITATKAYKDILIKKGIKSPIHVIPSCIDTNQYYFDQESRNQIRSELKIENDKIVIAYLGKIGGMYMEDELFSFLKKCLEYDSDKFHFFLLTNYSNNLIENKLDKFNLPHNKIHSKYLKKEDVNKYLSAADIGFCGIRAIPSRRYSSPIKNGEYWACGLPVIIPEGISDDYIIIDKENIGVVFNKIEEISIREIEELLRLPRTKIRKIGLRERAISGYISKWEMIFTS